jgi:hypothetical protein
VTENEHRITQQTRKGRNWLVPPSDAPDFKQIVDKTLAVFAVFTGATFTFYVKDFLLTARLPKGFEHFAFWERALVAAAVMSLLLRYIVGSAAHLNTAFVPKVSQVAVREWTTDEQGRRIETVTVREREVPRNPSIRWLFFDIVWLVIFGVLAVQLTLSSDMRELMWSTLAFVTGGFLWSLLAVWCRRGVEQAVAHRWVYIDLVQGFCVFALIWLPSHTYQVIGLAALSVVCLFIDFSVLSRPAEVWEEEAGAVAAPARP